MSAVSWAILGTGHMAKKFIAASRLLDGRCRILALGGRDHARTAAFAHAHGLDVVCGGPAEAIAAPGVEAVYVALPNHLHETWSIHALKNGKAVLCEKPAATELSSLQRILHVAAQEKRLFYEGYLYRSHPGCFKLRDLVRDGIIGQPILASGSFCFSAGPAPKPRLVQPEFLGGSLRDVGVYPLGWMRLLLGEEPDRVAGTARRTPLGVDTLVAASLHFPTGAIGCIRCSFDHAEPNEGVICGTSGRITVVEPWRLPGGRMVARVELSSGDCRDILVEHAQHDPMARQIELFQQHLDKLEIPTMTWSDSLAQAAALDRIRAALELP